VWVSRQAGIVLIAGGLLTTFGWLAGIDALVSLRAGWASTVFGTALSFVLLGMSFVLPQEGSGTASTRLAARFCAGAAGMLALLAVLQYLGGLEPAVHRVLIGPAGAADVPGRMSGAAAAGVLLLAASALFIDWKTPGGLRPSLLLAPVAGTIGLLGVIAHFYDAASLYAVPFFYGLSMPTSILLVVASIGILGAYPDTGPLGVIAGEGPGSRLARRLLPLALVIPALIGWARLAGERAGYYGFEFGLALFAVASILVLLTMTWLTATSLNREEILRRRADEALEADAIRRRILFAQAKDGILLLGPDHRVVEANESFSAMIGYTPAAVAALHPWDWIVDSRTREHVVSDWSSLGRDGATFEACLRRSDGRLVDAEVSCTGATFDTRQYLFLVCRDITERKRSEQALHASEERFRRALANIPDTVVIYDTDLRIQYVNNATRSLTGLAPETLIGKRDEEVLSPGVCDAYLPTLRKAFLSRQICAVECEIELPEAGRRSLRVTCVPLLDGKGEVREILSVTRDLTSRKRAEEVVRASEKRFRELIEQAPTGIVVGSPEGRVELVNSRCCELLGRTEAELLGQAVTGLLDFAGGEPAVPGLDEIRRGDDLRFERWLKRRDGSVFPAEIGINVLESGARQLTIQDISRRHLQERKIARLNRIRAVTSSINAAIVRLRNRDELLAEACRIAVSEGHFCTGWAGVIDDGEGELVLVAQSGMGEDCAALMNEPVELLPEGATENAIYRQEPVFDNDIERQRGHTPIRACARDRGAKSVISLPLIVEGATFGVIVLYADERNFFDDEELKLLTELAEDVSFGLEFIAKEERVDFLAYYDLMTGLPNRSLFFNRLSRQLQDAVERRQRTVLAVFDIDRFRMINDTYGRHEGDAVIAEVAQRMNEVATERDTVARISANAFAIAISDDWDDADIGHRLEELDDALFAAAFRIGDEDVRVTASTGASVYPDDADSPEALLGNAEAALRSAKSGSIRRQLYSRDMNERVAESLRFENRVRASVDSGELALWYQPKVCARTGRLRGLEALMRWKDPETGEMIPPDRFIPVMEHTGTILKAGRWALQQVASDCLRWQERGVSAPRVAVNVSPIQLAQQNLVGSLVEAQIVANDAGTAIDLEITESVIMDRVDEIIPKLRTLASVGTRIHVDDFGTGYSSLAYIAKLPIHALKIDRSFVSAMHADAEESLGIVRSIISLAKSMKLQVIAEGVETAEQVALLRDLDCDELQGYHVGRPLPPEETFDVIVALSGEPDAGA